MKQPISVDQSSLAELWQCVCVPERCVPRMLGDMPVSTYNLLKRKGYGPRVFGLGKRRFVLVADLKRWLEESAERWGAHR